MKDKTFDCVKLKNDIQQELLDEMRTLSPDEWNEATAKVISSNPILASIWKQARKIGRNENKETIDKETLPQKVDI